MHPLDILELSKAVDTCIKTPYYNVLVVTKSISDRHHWVGETKELLKVDNGMHYMLKKCIDTTTHSWISFHNGSSVRFFTTLENARGYRVDLVLYAPEINRRLLEKLQVLEMPIMQNQINNKKLIKIRYLSDKMEELAYIGGKSDWIDLRAAEDVELKQGEFKLIPLGVAMQLPTGYEAHIIPRSSTYKNFGVIQANHMGLIDEAYCGDNDQWYFPAIALRDTTIHAGDRICQFRIMEHQPYLHFEKVETLGNTDRGGLGSTGRS